MKISVDEVSRILANPRVDRGAARSTATPSASEADANLASPAAAKVEISATAQEVQQIKRMLNRLPDTREERVRELKAQVENGTYHVSGEEIADLIIRRALADSTGL